MDMSVEFEKHHIKENQWTIFLRFPLSIVADVEKMNLMMASQQIMKDNVSMFIKKNTEKITNENNEVQMQSNWFYWICLEPNHALVFADTN